MNTPKISLLAGAIVAGLLYASAAAGQPAPPAPAEGTAAKAVGDDDPADPPKTWRFEPVVVIGQRLFPYQEGMVLDERYLQEQVKGNGDIGTALRINPNVQFDDSAFNSRNMGEIRPADISINGGLYYQNAFVLDGAGFTNDLDPASDNPNHFADPPSHTQGVALDTSLIGQLTVYDSNVPAAFGGFNGGVVEVESRRARDALSGKVSLRMSRSVWNEIIVDDSDRDTFEASTSAANMPEYDKYQINATLEGRTANGLGLIGNITRTRSVIPLRGYSAGGASPVDDNVKEQVRENTSLSMRADWDGGDGLTLGASVTHAPTDERYFIQNSRDSFFDLKQGGPVVSLRAGLVRGAWSFSNTLSYSDLDSSRRSDVAYWYSWRWSPEKNWGASTTGLSTEGNWGNVDQTNRNVGYSLKIDRDPVRWGATEHRLQFGLQFSDRRATYERLNDHISYISPAQTATCTATGGAVDTSACSLSPVPIYNGRGQYLRTRTTYQVGGFEAESREWSLYAQDDIRLGRWSFRPGVRVDRDSLSEQTTIAPRFAMSWDLFGDQKSLLTGGVNRYYGRNLFAYKLREGRESLQLTSTRGANLLWSTPARDTTQTRFASLDVPYSDELALGLNQRLGEFDANFKYVHRRNRDEVMRVRVPSNDTSGTYALNVFEYRNVGRAENDTYTLGVGLRSPWAWGPASTTAQLALDYTDTRRAYTGATQDYSTIYSESAYNATVRYEGEIMRYYEIPADSFNRPWTARLATQTRIESWGLLWSNFLRYRAGYRGIARTGSEVYEDESIDVYESIDHPNGWTWDSSLEYTAKLPRAQEAFVRVEAMNLLNRKTLVESAGVSVYEPGRSYWVEVGYRF
jgi:hypothetical protein